MSKGVNDKAATDDQLGISAYTDALTEFIRNCAMPMTIAVQGSWGEGKTTVMNIVQYELEKKEASEPTVKTAWFNTWQYSQFEMDDTLSLSLLEYLAETCDPNGDMKAIIRACIKGLRKLVWPLAIELSPVKPIKGFTFKAANSPEAAETEETNRIKAIEELKNAFGKLIKKSLGIGKDETEEDKAKRFVVFIDDLDRLNPEKAVEVLEVLKLFLENDHCVFVLAIDYDVIVRGVEAKYGDTNGKANIDARKFFDKIIQVPFRLPMASYNISEYVKDLLIKKGNILPDTGTSTQSDYYVYAIRYSIGSNPRTIKRLLNAFQLQLYAMRNFDKPAQERLEELRTLDKPTEQDQAELGKLKTEQEELRTLDETRKKLLFALCCLQLDNEEMYDVIARKLNADASTATDAENQQSVAGSLLDDLRKITRGEMDAIDKVDFSGRRKFLKEMLALLGEDQKNDELLYEDPKNNEKNILLLKSVVQASAFTVVSASEASTGQSFSGVLHEMSSDERKNGYIILKAEERRKAGVTSEPKDMSLDFGKPVKATFEGPNKDGQDNIPVDTHMHNSIKWRIDGLTDLYRKNGILWDKENPENAKKITLEVSYSYNSGERLFTFKKLEPKEIDAENGKAGIDCETAYHPARRPGLREQLPDGGGRTRGATFS